MEEKNTIKISLSTFLLLLTIIAIIVMGFFIYKLNNDKASEAQKSAELQSQIDNLKNTVRILENQTNTALETVSGTETKEFQISGVYYQENAQGDEPTYTFLDDNKVIYGSLWTCTGIYTINNDTIKITFTSAADPEGNPASVTGYGVKESVELTIIDDNNIKDNSNGIVYSNNLTTTSLSETEAKELLKNKYNLAIELYAVSPSYFEISNEPFERGMNDYIYLIKNYDDVVNDNFTNNMKSDFEKNATCLIIFQDNHWLEEGGGGFSTYDGIEEFKNIEITNNKISSTVKTKHVDGEGKFQEYKESTFSILKSGDKWLIDNFNSSDLK